MNEIDPRWRDELRARFRAAGIRIPLRIELGLWLDVVLEHVENLLTRYLNR